MSSNREAPPSRGMPTETQNDAALGRLIVLEGPDGVGKSETSAALAQSLRQQGRPCELLSFPGRDAGTLGALVYGVHHEPARFGVGAIAPAAVQALHIAAHIDAIERRIVPALRGGSDIVLDRFWWSTWVYGVIGGADRRLLRTLLAVERAAWGDACPRLAVLLRRDAPLAREHENMNRWLALRAEYDRIAKREGRTSAVLTVANAADVMSAVRQILAALDDVPPPGHGAHDEALGDSQVDPSAASPPHSHAIVAVVRNAAGSAGARSASPAADIVVKHLAPAKVTVVYETYWRFAAERQRVFFGRLAGNAPPLTDDPILAAYKFTNAYRAADRVSQFLIRDVIYRDGLCTTPSEVVFRILLFKFFNKIETWRLLERQLGPLTWETFSASAYDRVLSAAMSARQRIYSAAYIMPPGSLAFGHTSKHRNHLALLELMMRDEVPKQLAHARTMHAAFDLLRSYATIGDFLAYQFVTDINYSEVTDFSEMEFVVPGPGALSGIQKCFENRGGLNEPEIIRLMTDIQAGEFERLGIEFQSLWGRPLQLIDCQNLFCEVDKYARVRHPDVEGRAGRTQIKQKYVVTPGTIEYWFPPKWGINARIAREPRGPYRQTARELVHIA